MVPLALILGVPSVQCALTPLVPHSILPYWLLGLSLHRLHAPFSRDFSQAQGMHMGHLHRTLPAATKWPSPLWWDTLRTPSQHQYQAPAVCLRRVSGRCAGPGAVSYYNAFSVYDFLLSAGVRPWIEIGYCPCWMSGPAAVPGNRPEAPPPLQALNMQLRMLSVPVFLVLTAF